MTDIDPQEPVAPPQDLPPSDQVNKSVPLLDLNKRRLTLIYDASDPQGTFLISAEGYEAPIMMPSKIEPVTGTPMEFIPMTPHIIMQRSQMRQALLMAI